MNWYNKAKLWLRRKAVRGALLIIILLIAAYFAVSTRNGATEEIATELLPVVTVTTAEGFAGASTINLIGIVRAFSEASVTAEKTGRVTSVRVGLGDQIAAGSIIATIENASEQASVLSAQGSYDAALASLEQSRVNIAQSQVGTSESGTRLRTAQNNAVSVIQTSYNSAEGAIFNNVDQFFTNPDGFVPGLRISGQGFAAQLNEQRVAFQTILPAAERRTRAVTVTSDLPVELEAARALLAQTINILDTFSTVFNQQEVFNRYSQEEVVGFGTSFNAVRGSLIQQQSQIDAAIAGLDAARDGIARAAITVDGSTTAAAEAQVKQALGSLRSAQANLAKTVIRTPISGTVNSLSIRTGDFVNSSSQVAEVANNNALEVVTFVGEKDRAVINVGDTLQIEGRFAGTVTEIAPAVDTGTGKTEVRVASESEDLQNGDTVRITKQVESTVITDVIIPLSAVKFALSDGSVFMVVDGKLTPRSVTLGTIRGGSVEILGGLAADEEFVADARGLVEATEVEVIR